MIANYISFLKHIAEMGFRVGCWGPIASQSDTVPVHPAFSVSLIVKKKSIPGNEKIPAFFVIFLQDTPANAALTAGEILVSSKSANERQII